jgi:tRNA A37 N6-isopentenylltransferase MiaA
MAATFSKDDFRRIRLSLAAAAVMIVVGGAIVYASVQLRQAEVRNKAAAQAKRMDSQGKLARARDEEQEVKKKIARFNELSGRGIFGEEMRLDWVEEIRRIKDARKLFDIQYEIAPQQPIDGATLPGSSANFEFLSSTMQMRMKLLHEEDLLNFLSDLRATAKAYIRVRRCDVERLPKATGDGRGVPPQLGADCTVEWITLRERKGA